MSVVSAEPPSAVLERIVKPWGEELVLSRSAETVVKALRIAPGRRLSLQYHRRKRETLMLLRGEARLTVGPDAQRLREEPLAAGRQRTIAAGVLHRISAGGAGAEILEVASRLPDDAEDIVRLADDYGRAGRPARDRT